MGHQLNRSFTLKANLELAAPTASGVIMALGSRFSGWSLFLEEGRPVFVFARSLKPQDTTRIAASSALGSGAVSVELRFTTQGAGKPARIPPTVEIDSPGWFEIVDPSAEPSLAVRGTIGARAGQWGGNAAPGT